jgi:hypothetical protein
VPSGMSRALILRCILSPHARAPQCQVKVVIALAHTLSSAPPRWIITAAKLAPTTRARDCNYRAKTRQFRCEIIVTLITDRRRLNYFLPIALRMEKFHTILSLAHTHTQEAAASSWRGSLPSHVVQLKLWQLTQPKGIGY